ncbi:PREDICTED: uncharacterized protein LOC109182633 [Ipomoea nil]|uniref:uncharacterized protein LOC109182633 n=1 Tax=Ipomoea nil TaxID=35883 RepID=UPI000900D001|nr:PREDICTED: uncharacterized protein LOC109182633 [Ipomoea nil]
MSELCLPWKTWFSSLLISDLKRFCSFLFSHPLYLSYFVFFSPYLFKIVSFLFPLVFTTSLLLLAFLTVSPGLIAHGKVGDLLSACHAVVEDGTQECFDLEDFEAYKIVFEGPLMDVQESQAQFSEQSLVEDSMEEEEKKLEDLVPKVESSTLRAPYSSVQRSISYYNSMTQQAVLNVGASYTSARKSISENSVAQQTGLNVGTPYTLTQKTIWKDINQDNSVTQQAELNAGAHKELVGELESMGSVKDQKKVEAQGTNADKVVENLKVRNGSKDEETIVNKTKTKTKTSIPRNDSQSLKVESSRTLDYNLAHNGSMRKEKEWKRTLACKLYEERNTRDVSGEGMDLLWETYEMEAIKSKKMESKKKAKKKWESKRYNNKKVESEDEEEEEEEEVYDQLCCLQALKFSAGKVNLGMGIGKPNLMKISKAIKGFGWLHHVSSKHSKKVHIEDRL